VVQRPDCRILIPKKTQSWVKATASPKATRFDTERTDGSHTKRGGPQSTPGGQIVVGPSPTREKGKEKERSCKNHQEKEWDTTPGRFEFQGPGSPRGAKHGGVDVKEGGTTIQLNTPPALGRT